jgi:hypothetical protein
MFGAHRDAGLARSGVMRHGNLPNFTPEQTQRQARDGVSGSVGQNE